MRSNARASLLYPSRGRGEFLSSDVAIDLLLPAPVLAIPLEFPEVGGVPFESLLLETQILLRFRKLLGNAS